MCASVHCEACAYSILQCTFRCGGMCDKHTGMHNIYTVSQKTCDVKLFAITSLTVNHFENYFTVGNGNELAAK